MAKSRESSVRDKIAEVTECSICVQIFTNPKILPCVHTFCLPCLKYYGKDKKPGDGMVCPICRNKFFIPDGGLCNLPNNFLVGKMLEIGKLATTAATEAICDLCPEGEEFVAKMYCIDCEQILCERCSKSHRKTKFSQNHQVIELGSKLNAQNFNLRNSYCDHHPKELIKLYCYDDDVVICVICCVESHQSHRCVNVEKAAGEFTEQLKVDLEKVTMRLPECENVREKLDKYEKEFTEQISRTEETICDIGTKLKALILEHTEILIKGLKLTREQNFKAIEITKQDVDRFRAMIDSFSSYSEELLSRGSSVDICLAANQLQKRANELEQLPSNCSGNRFCCNTIAFHPSSFQNTLKQCRSNNIVGELTVTESPDRIIKFEVESTAAKTTIQEEVLVNIGDVTANDRSMFSTFAKKPSEDASQVSSLSSRMNRMVYICGIPPEMTRRMLTRRLLKNCTIGGIEAIDYSSGSNTATVTLTNPGGATFVTYNRISNLWFTKESGFLLQDLS